MHYPQLYIEQGIFLQVIPGCTTVSCYKESVMTLIEKIILLGHKFLRGSINTPFSVQNNSNISR